MELTNGHAQLSPKRERPRFFRSISKKSLASLPTTPSIDSEYTRDPMNDARTPTPDDKRPLKSPSKISASLLWQPKQKSSEDANGDPVLAKSRRAGTFKEITDSPSRAAPPSPGYLEFRIPDMHPKRPPMPRYASSQVSPRDDSMQGKNHHVFDPFEKAIAETEGSKK
jgi:hypothetical protein